MLEPVIFKIMKRVFLKIYMLVIISLIFMTRMIGM
ncbi:hypothetical protein N008_00130 [Hymenobacter sp. APR13]|nr:hypothetical protein N008_00130 [Hymenobacter sp. APR13]